MAACALSVTNVNTQPIQNFPGGHKVLTQFPTGDCIPDCILEIQEEERRHRNAWSLDGYTDPAIDYASSDLDWRQLKPDVFDSILTDIDLYNEDNWDASAQEVIRPVTEPKTIVNGPVNRNKLRQAWFPFYQSCSAQVLPFPTRVHLGAGVSVPRHFMPIPRILFTTPKSRKGSAQKRRRPNRDFLSPSYSTKKARQGYLLHHNLLNTAPCPAG